MPLTQQYLIYIRADSLDEATEQSLHFAYWFLTRALQEHQRRGSSGDFESFALQVLALLQQYRHTYSTPPEPLQDPSDT